MTANHAKGWKAVTADEFMEANEIAIYAEADLPAGPFRIIKRGGELESYSLFEQLILFQSAESLGKYVEGQLLPRIWTQGKTRCVLSMPDAHRIIALFYDSNATAAENYRFALKLDAELRETSFADTPHGAADCADVQRGNAPL